MWHDHPFSQRDRIIERTCGVEFGGDREVGERGMDKIRAIFEKSLPPLYEGIWS